MTMRSNCSTWLALLIAVTAVARAQDTHDLVGEWAFTGSGFPTSDRCGDVMLSGRLLVTKKITVRAYRGKFDVRETTSKCRSVLARSSEVTLRIKGDKVSIEYDDDGWESDSLVLSRSEMTGKRSNGVETLWIKQTHASDVRSLTSREVSELDELFRALEPDFAAELRRRLGRRIRAAIEKSGVDSKKAKVMSDQTLNRMAACAVVSLKKQVRAKPESLEQILVRGRYAPAINPRSVDYAKMECIQAAALNVGVIIR